MFFETLPLSSTFTKYYAVSLFAYILVEGMSSEMEPKGGSKRRKAWNDKTRGEKRAPSSERMQNRQKEISRIFQKLSSTDFSVRLRVVVAWVRVCHGLEKLYNM